MVFTESNLGSTLLVCHDTKEDISDFYDNYNMNLRAYSADEYESVKTCDMNKYIYHKSDIIVKDFIPSWEVSRYDFIFFKNEKDNGDLKIDDKIYYRPSMYLVEIRRENFLCLYKNYDVDPKTVRFILHKISPDEIENDKSREFLSMLSEYLLEK